EDAVEDATVIHSLHPTRLVGQHRLNGRPFMIGEFIAHGSSPRFRSLNHDPRAGFDGPSIRRRLRAWRRFWGKPDINRLTNSAEPVENDPQQSKGSLAICVSFCLPERPLFRPQISSMPARLEAKHDWRCLEWRTWH